MLRCLFLLLLLTADLLPTSAQLLAPTTLTTALSRPSAPVGTELDVLLDPGEDAAPPVAYEPDAARFADFLAAGLRRYQQPALAAAR